MNPKLSRAAGWMMSLIGLMVLIGTGCGGGAPKGRYQAYTVVVELDPALAGKSVIVDLIGVNTANSARLENYSMTRYWSDGDATRRDSAKHTFDMGSSTEVSLPVKDPIWATWLGNGAQKLLILADLPGVHSDVAGAGDARRQVLSLDANKWASKTKELRVRVQASGIEVKTPLNPKAQ